MDSDFCTRGGPKVGWAAALSSHSSPSLFIIHFGHSDLSKFVFQMLLLLFFAQCIFWLNTLFEKSNFCPKIQFWQNPNIFTQIFLTIFLVKSKLSTAKESKPKTFSKVFPPPKKIYHFLGKSKLNFWTKNEDFEQCVRLKATWILKWLAS